MIKTPFLSLFIFTVLYLRYFPKIWKLWFFPARWKTQLWQGSPWGRACFNSLRLRGRLCPELRVKPWGRRQTWQIHRIEVTHKTVSLPMVFGNLYVFTTQLLSESRDVEGTGFSFCSSREMEGIPQHSRSLLQTGQNRDFCAPGGRGKFDSHPSGHLLKTS